MNIYQFFCAALWLYDAHLSRPITLIYLETGTVWSHGAMTIIHRTFNSLNMDVAAEKLKMLKHGFFTR